MRMMLAAAAAAALFLCGNAQGQSEPIVFDLYNDTDFTITYLYISVPSTNDWEEDILGDQTVDPGETVEVTVDDELLECEYDLRADFDDGDSLVIGEYDLCELDGGTLTIN